MVCWDILNYSFFRIEKCYHESGSLKMTISNILNKQGTFRCEVLHNLNPPSTSFIISDTLNGGETKEYTLSPLAHNKYYIRLYAIDDNSNKVFLCENKVTTYQDYGNPNQYGPAIILLDRSPKAYDIKPGERIGVYLKIKNIGKEGYCEFDYTSENGVRLYAGGVYLDTNEETSHWFLFDYDDIVTDSIKSKGFFYFTINLLPYLSPIGKAVTYTANSFIEVGGYGKIQEVSYPQAASAGSTVSIKPKVSNLGGQTTLKVSLLDENDNVIDSHTEIVDPYYFHVNPTFNVTMPNHDFKFKIKAEHSSLRDVVLF